MNAWHKVGLSIKTFLYSNSTYNFSVIKISEIRRKTEIYYRFDKMNCEKCCTEVRSVMRMRHLHRLGRYRLTRGLVSPCCRAWQSRRPLSVLSIQLPYTTFRSMLHCYSSLSLGPLRFLVVLICCKATTAVT